MFQRRFFSRFGLWTLAPRARAALFEYMQSVRVLENITFCSLFSNRLRGHFATSIITVTSINHLFLFSSETWDAALSSLSLSVFVMIFCVFLGQFLILSHCRRVCCISARLYSITSRHCSVQFIRSSHLFGRTPKEGFLLFSAEQFRLPSIRCIPILKCYQNVLSPNFWMVVYTKDFYF